MNVPNGDNDKEKAKFELLEELKELGYVIRGPITPGVFRKSKFRKLVLKTGVGQIFADFIRQVVFADSGAGAPKLRNLHVHNGTQEFAREVKLGRKAPPTPNPPKIPAGGGVIAAGDWAFNDSFLPDGHLSNVATLTIELEMEGHPGVKFGAEVSAGAGETIETAWVEVFGGAPGDLHADVILWAGTDESNVQCLLPQVVSLQQLP